MMHVYLVMSNISCNVCTRDLNFLDASSFLNANAEGCALQTDHENSYATRRLLT